MLSPKDRCYSNGKKRTFFHSCFYRWESIKLLQPVTTEQAFAFSPFSKFRTQQYALRFQHLFQCNAITGTPKITLAQIQDDIVVHELSACLIGSISYCQIYIYFNHKDVEHYDVEHRKRLACTDR